ncbi:MULTISPECIES: cell division protein ZapE [Kitasatospora]|uniref:Cell division protein ZapE n=1 Tax=Kitasatospora cathayae TaxID=3004092 RepID=A0ABY7PYS3_9ACTN|nr:cell division protein ZapE [Kitasatospora sp. HUAS 3-15]WBP85583.1 cell division protein ZapE [Kitasatospora sp. HUAS 3-15]
MIEKFERAAEEAGFVLDASQIAAAERLSALAAELTGRRRFFGGKQPRGVYVWGPVGRGKSWLTGVFYEALPVRNKRRVHFHEFFREFHAVYARHRKERNACDLAVAELLSDCRLLFFDEFHVHDPGDAMMMGRVLTSLFDQKVTLVTTSNYPPDGLLPNPVYHHMFEPTIKLLEGNLDVLEVAGPQDYRAESTTGAARSQFQRGAYIWPGTEQQLREAGLEPPTDGERQRIDIGGRDLVARAVRDDLVWFDFHELCDERTSTIDYLGLADRFGTWVLSGLPELTSGSRDAAQRFANLVDVLCDRDAKLYLVADGPLADCLRGDALPIDINRTASRLMLLPGSATPGATRATRQA